MKWLSAGISFIIVFVIVFILGAWFLMPHLPPIPLRPISLYQLEYPTVNWAGALLLTCPLAMLAGFILSFARPAKQVAAISTPITYPKVTLGCLASTRLVGYLEAAYSIKMLEGGFTLWKQVLRVFGCVIWPSVVSVNMFL